MSRLDVNQTNSNQTDNLICAEKIGAQTLFKYLSNKLKWSIKKRHLQWTKHLKNSSSMDSFALVRTGRWLPSSYTIWWVISMKKFTSITDASHMWGLPLKCHFLINHSWCALWREFVIGSINYIRLKYGIISCLVISFSVLRFSFRLLVLLKTLMDDDIKDNCNYFLNKPLPNVDGS